MTEQSVRLLVFAVRHRVVLKYLGVLLLSMAPMAAVPILVALHGEAYESANRFALVALLLVIGTRWRTRIMVLIERVLVNLLENEDAPDISTR